MFGIKVPQDDMRKASNKSLNDGATILALFSHSPFRFAYSNEKGIIISSQAYAAFQAQNGLL
jgi:hypothetical protein